MKISNKSQSEILVWSFLVILTFLSLYNLSYGDKQTFDNDTVYFEPVPTVKMSPDRDTFYVNPGADVKIKMNLKNDTYIAAFTAILKDECYTGNIFLDSAKNNGSAAPKCFEGSRAEHWGVTALNLNLYPPDFLLGATAMMTDPLPPGDGPLATLTFTAFDSGSICLDTLFTPVGIGIELIDTLTIGYTPVFISGIFTVSLCPYNPGDLNWDDIVDILDVPLIVYYLFKGWEAPCPIKAADANCDQEVTIADAVYLVNYILRSGPAPQICDY
ncbi:MAG: dockerin type I domain-containing protein [Candidatus Zixiibacteriota bacterium]